MENRESDHGCNHDWRGMSTNPPSIPKKLVDDESSERLDSGYGSISYEDRSLTGSYSSSDRSRDQVCGRDSVGDRENDSGLAQEAKKLTISDVSGESGYFDSSSEVGDSPYSSIGSSKPSFINSYAQSSDIRYLLAPFWRCLVTQNEDGDTSLHLAIINCQEKVVDAIVDVLPQKEYLDTYNYLTQTPLHLAVITRQHKIVQKLLDRGASVDLLDRNGQTCVHLACQRNDVRMLKTIFKRRPDKPQLNGKLEEVLETRNFEGVTPLFVAVSENNLDVVKLLVSFGANVHATDGKSGHTALHLAVEQNNLPMVSYLLFEANAHVNATSCSDCTPLHLAAGLGLKSIVATLIAAGGDQTLENSEGETAFEIASSDVEYLLECPVEPMED